MDIAYLMIVVPGHWPFSEDNYPDLRGASDAAAMRLKLGHVAHHLSTASGDFSRVCERIDHGIAIDDGRREFARKAIRDSIIGAIRAADLLGITSEELEGDIGLWVMRRLQKRAFTPREER